MRVIWSGTTRSETRTDKGGQPVEYRLTVYDDGQASCSCPAFIFQSLNNPAVLSADKLKYRCKHLVAAFAANDFTSGAPATTPAPGPAPAPAPTPPNVVRRVIVTDDLWGDDTDTTPRTRR